MNLSEKPEDHTEKIKENSEIYEKIEKISMRLCEIFIGMGVFSTITTGTLTYNQKDAKITLIVGGISLAIGTISGAINLTAMSKIREIAEQKKQEKQEESPELPEALKLSELLNFPEFLDLKLTPETPKNTSYCGFPKLPQNSIPS